MGSHITQIVDTTGEAKNVKLSAFKLGRQVGSHNIFQPIHQVEVLSAEGIVLQDQLQLRRVVMTNVDLGRFFLRVNPFSAFLLELDCQLI